MYSVLKARDLHVYALQTSIVNLQSAAWDMDLGGLVTLSTNFQPGLFFAPHTLAIKYIWRLQFLSLLRVLWCELACFLFGFHPCWQNGKTLSRVEKEETQDSYPLPSTFHLFF